MTGLVLPSRTLWSNLVLKNLSRALEPLSAEEEEREKAPRETQGQQAVVWVGHSPEGTSSEEEEEEEEGEGGEESGSDSSEEEAEVQGVLRVLSALPARSRWQSRRRGRVGGAMTSRA
ncbi:hypothetical protein NSK_005506 [Nannochloropsis salina CCMP1776]|jgi:hypothetical protein|uniref:Uncharacterized protein n=1 Tax=Nannochloropsis salina CCMP1776 TaxID=1027361 RepID=A0A4D9CYC1_9STRA|nr:hypothetical protein NSK_005506 [Nannochloropsis salina CCMP1776]|eukprot:TFJ83197.1 hypothetical protein NSK_005506 [Nannochloropsis salina CCMP1776]